jgi:hypothetical protein
MNGTETAYASILELRKLAGDITDYGYERMSLKLGDDCRLTMDFDVHLPDGEVQFHEVKANSRGKPRMEDDARVKLKVAADTYPFRIYVCYPVDRTKERFHIERFGGEE